LSAGPTDVNGHPQPLAVRGAASLVEQLARRISTICWTGGDMQPVHWSALRYFAMAGPTARTVVGLARFQGTTPGTVSRTIGVLIKNGLVESRTNPGDRRAKIVSLTEAGRQKLERDPLRIVERAIAAMDEKSQQELAWRVSELMNHLNGEVDATGKPD
jgi:DNA-binding MarR family transcriptional regulator